MTKKLNAAIDRAFDVFKDVMEHPEKYPADAIVVPIQALVSEKQTPFSKQRLRLLMEIRNHGAYESLDEVAAHLHREKTRVSKDVTFLEQMGLVKSTRVGRNKRLVATKRQILLQ